MLNIGELIMIDQVEGYVLFNYSKKEI